MTEKNYNPEQKQIKTIGKREKMEKLVTRKQEEKAKITDIQKKEIQKEEKIKEEEKKEEKAKEEKKKPKKTEAIVRGSNLPISSKQSFAICRFIKNKEINSAIKELEEILLHKRALPMKGEIPHRKGEIMSGRYPKNSVSLFIKLLKSLNANAMVNEISYPVIAESYANFASRPYGKFGRVRRKRTNVVIIARNKKEEKK